MGLFFLIILILLAVTGTLTFVLKVALGVALGVILGVALIGALVGWRLRRLLRGTQRRWREVQGQGSSHVEVLDRRDEPPRGY